MKIQKNVLTKQAYTQEGEKIILSYLVFQTDGEYGIEVRLKRRLKTESALFRGVTRSEKQAFFLRDRLANGLVTPVCLREILEDLLS